MKSLESQVRKILEYLVLGDYNNVDKIIDYALSALNALYLKEIEEKLALEPRFWTNMSKGLRNYNEGKRDYRTEALTILREMLGGKV